MKVPYGPHQRRGRQRRVGKALVLISMVSLLAAASSMTMDRPTPKDIPTPSQIAYARNLYNMTGYNGEAKIYIDRWPEYREYITGEKEIPSGWHQTGQN